MLQVLQCHQASTREETELKDGEKTFMCFMPAGEVRSICCFNESDKIYQT